MPFTGVHDKLFQHTKLKYFILVILVINQLKAQILVL